MSSKTVEFNKKKHKGNDWMTDDLLDLINLKNRLYKEFKQYPLNMWNMIPEKLTYRHVNEFIKETKIV